MTVISDYLEARTKRSAAWWMAAVQQAIQDASSPSTDPNHATTDPAVWTRDITRLVIASSPSTTEPYDGNLYVAAITSLILALWYARVHYAKTHDPQRPVAVRQASYEKLVAWTAALLSLVTDEREDQTFFPGQTWDFPYSYKAHDGDFV